MATETPQISSPISNPASNSDIQSNPFFLNHGDSPSTALVSQVLNADNYLSWRRSMQMALSAKNKLDFVNEVLPKPEPSDANYAVWIRCNDMVTSWLLNSISEDLVDSVLYIDIEVGIWKDLIERFSQDNGPRIFRFRSPLRPCLKDSTLSLHITLSLEVYGRSCPIIRSVICATVEQLRV
ncbi:hypothetical protein CJ030_MR0G007701 [Morella rubra]|uniref:Retrotransposon Copia-like N-terminal domain-containing protein n=1 Tax=Morella rubra TaxID=262757 RepID=A0A6A1UIQ6_9ROSI|nr:hypothetical protein CJ030_MR0G007701 [Morella rubra]